MNSEYQTPPSRPSYNNNSEAVRQLTEINTKSPEINRKSPLYIVNYMP